MSKTLMLVSVTLMSLGIIAFIVCMIIMVVVGMKSGSLAKSYTDHPGWMFGGSRLGAYGLAGHPKRALIMGIFRLSAVVALIGIVGMVISARRIRKERAELPSQSSSR
jgi:hypothetical protein